MQLALAALRNSNALHKVVDFDRYLFCCMFLCDPNFFLVLLHSAYSLTQINVSAEMFTLTVTLNCSYLRSIFSRQNSMHTMSELIESFNAIDSWVIVSHPNGCR